MFGQITWPLVALTFRSPSVPLCQPQAGNIPTAHSCLYSLHSCLHIDLIDPVDLLRLICSLESSWLSRSAECRLFNRYAHSAGPIVDTVFDAIFGEKISFFETLILCIFGLREYREIVGDAIWNQTH